MKKRNYVPDGKLQRFIMISGSAFTELLLDVLEMFLKKRYPNRQDDFYTRARMI